MRKILLFLFLFLVFPLQVFAQEDEVITNFRSEIVINQDTSLTITERIDYKTLIEKHGIFRYVPEKYREDGRIVSNPISDIRVEDERGNEVRNEVSRESNNVVLKIGDPDVTFSGAKTYVISYKVARAIKRQKGFDELYWDITGEGWDFPILRSSVRVITPYADIQEVRCFTGPVGRAETNCEPKWQHDSADITATEQIYYGQNFTIAVKLNPNNTLIFPSAAENLLIWIWNNLAFFLLPLPGLIMFIYWYKKGRDYRFVSPNVFNLDPNQPQGMKPIFESMHIPFVYEPISQMTPGEAGAIMDERVDNQDVIAEIIDLCRKKYMKVERIDNKGFLKFGHDYLFTKLKEPVGLPEHQKYLLENIFDAKTEIKLGELKGKFFTHMDKVKEMLYERLTEKKYFTEKPVNSLGKALALAVILDIVTFYLSIGSITFLESGWPVAIMMASFMISLIMARKMTQKTAVGTNLSLQAKGLRETIRLGKWREEVKEKHLFIEEVLPFAISLGVISKLTRDMSTLNMAPPDYFNGGFAGNPGAWSGFMNDFSKSATSGLSYNPSSSSSGGSGFSGGSSGGGGGGGGGGSW